MTAEVEEDACLRTRRLVLAPIAWSDAASIAAHLNDRETAQMMSRIPHPYGIADAHRFIDHLERADCDEIAFAVRDAGTDAFLGSAGLRRLEGERVFSLGYWIAAPFHGRGFATEAAQALIDHAFGRLDARLVEARCRVVNGASRRVIQKCGLHYAGTGMDIFLAAGRASSETYRMDRRCWLALKDWTGR